MAFNIWGKIVHIKYNCVNARSESQPVLISNERIKQMKKLLTFYWKSPFILFIYYFILTDQIKIGAREWVSFQSKFYFYIR